MSTLQPHTFAEFAELHKAPISQKLTEFFAVKKTDAEKLSPTLAHSVETLESFVLHGGKRVRSLLVLLGYFLAKGTLEQESLDSKTVHAIYSISAAIELVHKYLLVLDDIADQDEKRNDKPTIWKKYESEFADRGWKNPTHHGRTFAEIDSALLASFVTDMVEGAGFPFIDDDLLYILSLINKHMYFETVAGWQIQYELNHVPLSEATEAEFMKGLELVTARYTFVAPLKIGYSLGNEFNQEVSDALESYGVNVGTAFQIQDDILGLFGNPKETGKPVGNDVREGKKTLLLQQAYKHAHSLDQEFLTDVCGREMFGDELVRVQHLVTKTGALAHSQQLAKEYVDKGIAALEPLPDSTHKKILIDLANFVIQRKV